MICQSTPRHIWMHDLMQAVGATIEQVEPHRAMLNRWYNAGESVAIATPGLRFLIKQGEKRTFDDGHDTIRRAALAATKVEA